MTPTPGAPADSGLRAAFPTTLLIALAALAAVAPLATELAQMMANSLNR